MENSNGIIVINKIGAIVLSLFITISISLASFIYISDRAAQREFQDGIVLEMMYNRIQNKVVIDVLVNVDPEINNKIADELKKEKERSYYFHRRGGGGSQK